MRLLMLASQQSWQRSWNWYIDSTNISTNEHKKRRP